MEVIRHDDERIQGHCGRTVSVRNHSASTQAPSWFRRDTIDNFEEAPRL
ncbi:MAG: hypothetical protein M5R40_28800 [Anaerolineae bacterium]|nr:hypothetical protein [Anaerolineae bacterium]